jgi:hypothetical protein
VLVIACTCAELAGVAVAVVVVVVVDELFVEVVRATVFVVVDTCALAVVVAWDGCAWLAMLASWLEKSAHPMIVTATEAPATMAFA